MAEPTEGVKVTVDALLASWQDADALVGLMAVMQGCMTSILLFCGNGRERVPEPELLRLEAADLRYSANGVALFYEGLAERIEAAQKGS